MAWFKSWLAALVVLGDWLSVQMKKEPVRLECIDLKNLMIFISLPPIFWIRNAEEFINI
jgi:hypothetical protein